jgi:DNA-binding IclR family transcriptional regulator
MALQPAPSALRTVEIISFLADNPGKVFAVADLARRVGQSRATCQAVLLALEPSRWVVRTKDGYALGAGLISIGAAAQQGAAIVGLLREAVRELHEHTGCEILGYLPAGDRLINVSRVGPAGPGTVTMVEGQAFPLAPPNGLAFAAWDERDLELWLGRATTAGQQAQDNLRKAAEIVRELGYSVIFDPVTRRELRTNVDSLSAARQKFIASALAHHDLVAQEDEATGAMRVSLLSGPVFGSDGKVAALMGLVFDVRRYSDLAELATALKAACRQLSERLGASPVQALKEQPA